LEGSGRISPLLGVRPELDEVGRWLKSRRVSTQRIEDHVASKAAVLDGLAHSSLAHIACHGIFEADRPDASGLVLIPEDESVEVLSIRDLAQADLAGLRQVTLSACWSADNFVLPGRQVISLPETFCRSGAHSVLGCLWLVYDRSAVALMRRYYENLSSLPRDEALRRAQVDFLKGRLGANSHQLARNSDDNPPPQAERDLGPIQNNAVIDSAHPVAWAGFTLYGDPGQMRL